MEGFVSSKGTRMTEEQKKRVKRLRANGRSFREISEITGIGVSAIKMYCSRNEVQNGGSLEKLCLCCGKKLDVGKTGRPATFCSSSCRLKVWRTNAKEFSNQNRTCPSCGKTFHTSVPTRKYCSHGCYINARFGEGRHGA